MSRSSAPTPPELIASVESAWGDLHVFLSAITPRQASLRDHAGWSVRDHVTHMAAWEDSVAVLFRGGKRHEALGIDETAYAAGSFDEINEAIRKRFEVVPLSQAILQLEQIHRHLMDRLRTLSEVDLQTSVRDFFPQAPRTDDRPVVSLIRDNTAGHFTEHLSWMRELVGGAD